jgi:predicted enzyme related to lactoylglutathione lyase
MTAIHFDPVTLWVRDFDRCLTFYREVFELEVLRLFRGEDHPPWVEFRMGDSRFCLHGGYADGSRYQTATPLAVHFEVDDADEAVGRINRYGGHVRRGVVEEDNRPAELRKVRQAVFSDPDGNEFELLQVVSEYEPAAGDAGE